MVIITQKKFSIKFKEIFDKIFAKTAEHLKIKGDVKVNVWFLSKKEMKKLNNKHRNINQPTDVLSFPFVEYEEVGVVDFKKYVSEIDLQDGNLLLGEVFICTDIAKKQAKQFGHGINREFCFLFTHGLLHILGFDHEDIWDKKIMEDMQKKILTECEVPR